MRRFFLLAATLLVAVGISSPANADDGVDVLINNGGNVGTIIFTGGAFVANAGGYFGLGSALEFAGYADSAADQYAAMMDDDVFTNTGAEVSDLDFGG